MKTFTHERFLTKTGAPNVCSFLKIICSEDDLRSRKFGTFVVKFLACLPLPGFSIFYNFGITRLSARKSEQVKNY